jgi:hypothetical protein
MLFAMSLYDEFLLALILIGMTVWFMAKKALGSEGAKDAATNAAASWISKLFK